MLTHKPSFKRSRYKLYRPNSCAATMKPKITDYVNCDHLLFSLSKR